MWIVTVFLVWFFRPKMCLSQDLLYGFFLNFAAWLATISWEKSLKQNFQKNLLFGQMRNYGTIVAQNYGSSIFNGIMEESLCGFFWNLQHDRQACQWDPHNRSCRQHNKLFWKLHKQKFVFFVKTQRRLALKFSCLS